MTGLTIWCSIVGFVANLPNNEFDLYISVTALSTTSLEYKVSTISVKTFHLVSIVIGSYAYNTASTSFSKRSATYTLGTLHKFSSLTYSSANVKSSNTIVGIRSYHITNQAFYQYKIAITDGSGIIISSNVTVDYMQY